MKTRRNARAHLVESDMTVRPDTAEEEVDPSSLLDGDFVVLAFLVKIFGVAIEDVCILWAV